MCNTILDVFGVNLYILCAQPVFNLQWLLDGLFIGSVYALSAYGLALVWGVTNVKNLAQGDFVIAGGYITFWLFNFGIHPLIGMWVSAVIMFGLGVLMYHAIIKWVIDKDLFTSLLATFGIALVTQQVLNLIFGPEVQIVNSGLGSWRIFGEISVAQIKVVALVICVALAFAVVMFMKRSRMGQAIRATSQDPRAARVMGIDTEKVYSFTFALNAAICGAAGGLVVMIWNIQPFYGINYSIRAFVIVTSAGLGNLVGVILAGLGLGSLEQFGSFVFGIEWQQAIVMLSLIGVLIFRIFSYRKNRKAVS
ncbi:MAG: branched-chain amino acid ABC transporter permease [Alphaproteobacteria bacterium]